MRSFPEVGRSAEFTAAVEESAVAEFAELTSLDDPRRCGGTSAESTPHGLCLVSGALVVEFVSAALRSLVGEGYVLRGQEMRLPSAVSVGEHVTVRAEVVGVDEDERTISVETRIWRADGEIAFRGVGRVVQVEPSGQEV